MGKSERHDQRPQADRELPRTQDLAPLLRGRQGRQEAVGDSAERPGLRARRRAGAEGVGQPDCAIQRRCLLGQGRGRLGGPTGLGARLLRPRHRSGEGGTGMTASKPTRFERRFDESGVCVICAQFATMCYCREVEAEERERDFDDQN